MLPSFHCLKIHLIQTRLQQLYRLSQQICSSSHRYAGGPIHHFRLGSKAWGLMWHPLLERQPFLYLLRFHRFHVPAAAERLA